MKSERVNFVITRMEARAVEGVLVDWQGKEYDSGPLVVELDDCAASEANRGFLDYGELNAVAEFHVRLSFPEFAKALQDAGVDPAMTGPVRAVIRSQGAILEDHGFVLSGACELKSHALFSPENTHASVLPGH